MSKSFFNYILDLTLITPLWSIPLGIQVLLYVWQLKQERGGKIKAVDLKDASTIAGEASPSVTIAFPLTTFPTTPSLFLSLSYP